MIEILLFEIIYDDEAEEPYYTIVCTDQNNNAIELLFDNVFNTYKEAKKGLMNILNKINKGGIKNDY